eukprot:5947109-Prymnesium_polylepis.3
MPATAAAAAAAAAGARARRRRRRLAGGTSPWRWTGGLKGLFLGRPVASGSPLFFTWRFLHLGELGVL